MDPYSAPGGPAEKLERLRKNYTELARMNEELVAALRRQHVEINELINRNENVLRRCDEFFATEQAGSNGNGASAGDRHHA